MRIGVLSDTHGNMEAARLAVTSMGKIDLLLHAGDHYRDAHQLAKSKELLVCAVVGNCDWDVQEPADLLIDAAGKRIWLTHGHKYRVKTSHDALVKKALQHKIDVVVYGHTHVPVIEERQGILIFNPGSTTQPRGQRGPTYGVIEIDNQEIISQIFDL
ncbi:putative phosphoesterase [Desulfohalotomaculum tongense]|uniref:YfcE family phosphodiesterase n=1 Tax=Desulforadius tongensis TaxID=1216062 RepID=UPI00195C218F|nr:putative phosphoesterase [Desulforadius tongensis]